MRTLLSFASISLLLVGCTGTLPTQNSSDQSIDHTTSEYQQIVDTASKRITTSEEFNSCMQPHVESCLQSTGNDLALREKNTNICQELSTDDQRHACEFGVVLHIGYESGDPQVCDQISNPHYLTQCQIALYQQLAQSQGDASICDQIPLTEGEDDIISPQESRDQCRLLVITRMEESTPELCETITTPSIAQSCKDRIEFEAEMTRDLPDPIIPTPLPPVDNLPIE